MEITGHTKLAGIIGNPVEHSLSPVFQNAAFKDSKIDWVYIPIDVSSDLIPLVMQTVKAFFKGINVTMPYKQDVIPYMDEVAYFAKLVQAVNTIKVEDGQLKGFNTDGRGFLYALENKLGFSPEGKNITIIGAGGAARSITTILALSKVQKITIINRNVEKAEKLKCLIVENIKQASVDVLSLYGDLPKAISECDLIVNTTPVGMDSDESPLDVGLIRKDHNVADIVYGQKETRLISSAKKIGAKTMSGEWMLLYQGAASFEIWTEKPAPVEVMKKALTNALKK